MLSPRQDLPARTVYVVCERPYPRREAVWIRHHVPGNTARRLQIQLHENKSSGEQ